MKYSKIYIPTIKDVIPETEALNYRLLHKAGYVRKISAGLYTLLPLGSRALLRLKNMLENKMEALGCTEVHLTDAVSMEEFYDHIMAAPTSSKGLPMGVFHMIAKSAAGIRPRLGLLQAKSWMDVEGFKLLENIEVLKQEHHYAAEVFRNLLRELNISFTEAEQLSLDYAGEWDQMFIYPHEKGEDSNVNCKHCGKSYTIDSMSCKSYELADGVAHELRLEYTPQVKTIVELSAYLNTDAKNIVKTLIYKADDRLVGVLIRGDRDLSEVKLKRVLECRYLRAANEEEVFEATNAEIGFAGPIGLKAEILCDYEAAAMSNVIVGANKTDYHYINAVMGRDYKVDLITDLRCHAPGDSCPQCGGAVEITKGFILGSIRKKRTMENITVLGYELNLYRLLAAIAEQNKDEAGLIMPCCIAPFDIVVMAVHSDNEEQRIMTMQIYNTLKDLNYNVLLDDRPDRASVKFKDSELIGIPLRITVGRKINQGIVELKYRTAEMKEIHINDIVEFLTSNEVRHAEKAE